MSRGSGDAVPGAPSTRNEDVLSPLPPPVVQDPPPSSSPSMPGSLPYDEAGWDGVSSVGGHEQALGGGGAAASERLPSYGEGDEEALRANAEAERILAAERERKGPIE